MTPSSLRRPGARQSGFTIIEMMVAVSIALVILLGFAVSFVNMKTTFNSQNSLSQLQDNERLAMTVLTASIGEAGYFSNGSNLNASPPVPVTVTDRGTALQATTAAPTVAVGSDTVQGQYLFGTGDATVTPPVPETISTVYSSAPGDGLLSCQGGSNTSTTATVTIRNIFYVDATTNTLMCAVVAVGAGGALVAPTSSAQPLISNVKSIKAVYGLDSDNDGSIDTYKPTASMGGNSSANWAQVKNVKVTLEFINPNDPNNAANTIKWTQAINVMNNK